LLRPRTLIDTGWYEATKISAEETTVKQILEDQILTQEEFTKYVELMSWGSCQGMKTGVIEPKEAKHFWFLKAKGQFGEVANILTKHGFKEGPLFQDLSRNVTYEDVALNEVSSSHFEYRYLGACRNNHFLTHDFFQTLIFS